MPDYNVPLPPLGENAPDEAKLSFFLVEEGDSVNKDDELCEMITDKATFNVPAPISGVLKKKCVEEGQAVKVGQTLAIFEAP